MLDLVTTTSVSAVALTGASRPGAVPPAFITPTLTSQLAAPHAAASLSGHADAEVIDLAERVKALATRQDRVLHRSLIIHGRIDRWHFANRPQRPEPIPSEMTLVRSRTDSHEVTHIEEPRHTLAAQKAQREAYEAAEAAHEEAVERKRARTREPYLDKLQNRMWRRLECWVLDLAAMEPETREGVVAKAATSQALTHLAAEGMDWAIELSAAVSRDALRIIGAEADARAEEDRQADGELLALGRAWEASCTRYERACAAEEGLLDTLDLIAPPRALIARPGDIEATGCCSSRDEAGNPFGQPWYGRLDTIEALRGIARRAGPNVRRDEILAAYDRWRADVAAENERSGLAAAEAERQTATDENAALRARLCMMPARTPAGTDLKLRVIVWLHDGLAGLEEAMFPENVDDPHFGASLALSVVLDLARMGRGVVPVPALQRVERSAA